MAPGATLVASGAGDHRVLAPRAAYRLWREAIRGTILKGARVSVSCGGRRQVLGGARAAKNGALAGDDGAHRARRRSFFFPIRAFRFIPSFTPRAGRDGGFLFGLEEKNKVSSLTWREDHAKDHAGGTTMLIFNSPEINPTGNGIQSIAVFGEEENSPGSPRSTIYG